MKYLSVLLAMCFLSVLPVKGGIEEGLVSFHGGELTQAVGQEGLNIQDLWYDYMLNNEPVAGVGGWEDKFDVSEVENRVVLRFDDSNRDYYQSGWQLSVNYDLTLYPVDPTMSPVVYDDQSLFIDFEPTGSYEDQDLHVFTSNAIDGLTGYRAELIVNSVTPCGIDVVPEDVYLDLELHVNRCYHLGANIGNPWGDNVSVQVTDAALYTLDYNDRKSFELSWSFIEGAESYDVEWLFVDAAGAATLSEMNTATVDMSQATRIRSFENHYEIPLAYDKGVVVYRVRPVAWKDGTGCTEEEFGDWTFNPIGTTLPTLGAVNNAHYIAFGGLNPELNWQYSATYAEEGKRKEVLTVYDGLLNNRQTVTVNNSDQQLIIAESFYDYEGRPVVQGLPYVRENEGLQYYKDAGASYTKENYDSEDNFTDPLAMPTTETGVSQYYSPSNALAILNKDYLPDAEGYPFARNILTNDGTNRVLVAGGAGTAYKLGSGHESKMFYGKPTSQRELDRLFGNEAGDVSFYTKQLSIDPNGVLSVTYNDEAGHVVATGMAGAYGDSNTMEAIDNYSPGIAPSGSDLKSSLAEFTTADVLVGNHFENNSWKSVTDILLTQAPVAGEYVLTYSATTPDYTDNCVTDLTLDYDIYIRILDAYGEVKYDSEQALGTVSNTWSLDLSTLSLTQGMYRLEKTLRLNDAAWTNYQSEIQTNNCVEPIDVIKDLCGCKDIEIDHYLQDGFYIDVPDNTAQTIALLDGNFVDFEGRLYDNEAATILLDDNGNITNGITTPQAIVNDPDIAFVIKNTAGAIVYDFDNNFATGYNVSNVFNGTALSDIGGGTANFGNFLNHVSYLCADHKELDINPCQQDLLYDILPGGQYFVDNGTDYGYLSFLEGMSFSPLPKIKFQQSLLAGEDLSVVDNGSSLAWPLGDLTVADLYKYWDATVNLASGNQVSIWSTLVYSVDGLSYSQMDYDTFIKEHWLKLHPEEKTATILCSPEVYHYDAMLQYPYSELVADSKGLMNPLGMTVNTTIVGGNYANYVSGAAPGTDVSAEFDVTYADPLADYSIGDDLQEKLEHYHWDSNNGYLSIWYVLDNDDEVSTNLNTPGMDATTVALFEKLYNSNDGILAVPIDGNQISKYDIFRNYYNYWRNYYLYRADLAAMDNMNVSSDLDAALEDFGAASGENLKDDYLETVTDATLQMELDAMDSWRFQEDAYNTVETPTEHFNNVIEENCLGMLYNTIQDVLSIDGNVIGSISYTANGTAVSDLDAADCIDADDALSFMQNFVIQELLSEINWAAQDCTYWTDANISSTINTYITSNLATNGIEHVLCSDSNPETEYKATFTPTSIAASLDFTQPVYVPYTSNSNQITIVTTPALSACYASYENHYFEEELQLTIAQNEYLLAAQDLLYNYALGEDLEENFTAKYTLREYHYTLFYYDRAGNLVKTVPPVGVNPITSTSAFEAIDDYREEPETNDMVYPDHKMITNYKYNSLGQMRQNETPDGGRTSFWYDELGRIILSQSQRQEEMTGDVYSYVLYDDLGRVRQSGQMSGSQVPVNGFQSYNDFIAWMAGSSKSEVVVTYYDTTEDDFYPEEYLDPNYMVFYDVDFKQDHIRGRVVSTAYYENGNLSALKPQHQMFYSYDVHGNVKSVLSKHEDYKGYLLKQIDYSYDLISGNVKEVAYQKGRHDEYNHRYYYDADNRITEVLTSRDGKVWTEDANYFYYAHGPLARTEKGEQQVQGEDFAYTLQGWLKGVNSATLNESRDVGSDGEQEIANLHRNFTRDAMAFQLNYNKDDYSPTGPLAANFEIEIPLGSDMEVANKDLYNGNISNMIVSLSNSVQDENGLEEDIEVVGYQYTYDQLNRIKSMVGYRGHNGTDYDPKLIEQSNSFAGALSNGGTNFNTAYTYDANGNINSLKRHLKDGALIDDLSYDYAYETTSDYNNQLLKVDDNAIGDADDLDGIFEYDGSGNLIKDSTPGTDIDLIEWTANGKVKSITRTVDSDRPDMAFAYDAMGNRILKIVKHRLGEDEVPVDPSDKKNWDYIHYVRDANGALMASYNSKMLDGGSGFDHRVVHQQQGAPLYGSSRLGIDQMARWQTSYQYSDAIYEPSTLYVGPLNGQGETLTYAYQLFSSTDYNTPWWGADAEASIDEKYVKRKLGEKNYELSNHLGNVMTTLSDRRLAIAVPSTSALTEFSYETGFEGVDLDWTVSSPAGYTNILFDAPDPYQTPAAGQSGQAIELTYGPVSSPYMQVPILPGDQITVSMYSKLTADSPAPTAHPYRHPKLKVALVIDDASMVALDSDASIPGVQDHKLMYLTQSNWNLTQYLTEVPLAQQGCSFALRVYVDWDNETPAGLDLKVLLDDLKINVERPTAGEDLSHYIADVKSYSDYYPFGMEMPGRKGGTGYRFGFNGMEKDDEVKGSGNSYTTEFRQLDPRIGRWLSLDPLMAKFPHQSPYVSFDNSPILVVDPTGLSGKKTNQGPPSEDECAKTRVTINDEYKTSSYDYDKNHDRLYSGMWTDGGWWMGYGPEPDSFYNKQTSESEVVAVLIFTAEGQENFNEQNAEIKAKSDLMVSVSAGALVGFATVGTLPAVSVAASSATSVGLYIVTPSQENIPINPGDELHRGAYTRTYLSTDGIAKLEVTNYLRVKRSDGTMETISSFTSTREYSILNGGHPLITMFEEQDGLKEQIQIENLNGHIFFTGYHLRRTN